MTTTETPLSSTFGRALRSLYLVRFGFAVVWAVLLFLAAGTTGPVLTILLVVYPLFDAAAVAWQLRAAPASQGPKASEWVNVAVSIAVAIALGVASTVSNAAVLAVWGVWAIGAGIPQLVTAIRNRRSGGQVAQMLSGGISVLAGGAFLAQGLGGAGAIAGVGGYATLGAVFFLVSAIRLHVVLRKAGA
jgi:uncharacterized membrane protein HdeD (DUF308 family)